MSVASRAMRRGPLRALPFALSPPASHTPSAWLQLAITRRYSSNSASGVDIYADLKQRGLLKDTTADIAEMPRKGGVYIGFDPTAESLHIGCA